MDNPTLIAALAGAAGAIGAALFTLLDNLLRRQSDTQKQINETVRAEAENLRKEMRDQMDVLMERVERCEKDREELRSTYWTLFVKCKELQAQVDLLLSQKEIT